MSGGFAGYSQANQEPERLLQLKTAIRELSADIIGLVDTFRWDDLYSERNLCEMFGYRYAARINLNDDRLCKLGHNNGLAILSNAPLQEVKAVRIATRDALHAVVDVGNKQLNIVLAYLDYLSEDARLEQTVVLLKQFKATEPTIIMGDLNTFKRDDKALNSSDVTSFTSAHPELALKLDAQLRDAARGEVIAAFEANDWRDASDSSKKTFPSQLFPSKTEGALFRIDYVLHSPLVRVNHVSVPTGQVFQVASDHLPIMFEAELY